MQGFFDFLQIQMDKPANYGWFHLLFMAIIIAVTVLFIIKFKDCSDKTFRRIALISWIVMVVFEIYKQVVFTYDCVDGVVIGNYQWYDFPFQLCSSPLYILPFIAFMKEGKVRDYFQSFISTFALFGGFVVFFYPNDVFTTTLGTNIQTMIHHGLQIILGIFFAVHARKKFNIKYFIKSIPVFVSLMVIAIVLNEAVWPALAPTNPNDTLNMFYIASHTPNHLPLLSLVYSAVPWVAFLFIYLVGFTIASIAVFYAIVGGIKLTRYIQNKLIERKNA